MKRKITTAILTLATALGFAQDAIPETIPTLVQLEAKPAVPYLQAKVSPTRSFGYLRMGVSDSQLSYERAGQVIPGLGLGYRLSSGSSAIDLSASFNRRETRTDEGKEYTYMFTLPKANYLYYVSAEKNNSLYGGAGVAWGGVKTSDNHEFYGLIPNVALGYEMNRNEAWRSFVQLDVSQAAIAAYQKGSLPKPYAELSLGAGF